MTAEHAKVRDPGILEPHIFRGNISDQLKAFTSWASSGHYRIMDTIKHDHREMNSFYDLIIKSTDPKEQTKYQNQFTWEVARHTVGEELVVYPAFEKYLEDGKSLAEKSRAQHQSVKEQLKVFQDLKSTDAQFIPTLRALMDDLKKHINEEENNDIVKLEEALSQQESVELSHSLNRTKMFAPTRSHPKAPSTTPFETTAELMAAPLDYLSDMFRKWPEESKHYS